MTLAPTQPPKEFKRRAGVEAYELNETQISAVEMIAAGLTNQCIAEALNISSGTVTLWRRNPVFRERLAEAVGLDAEIHSFRLKAVYGAALDRCAQLMKSRNEHIALGATRLIMENYQSVLRQTEELEMVRALEAKMDELSAAASNGSMGALDAADDAEFIELDNSENGHS